MNGPENFNFDAGSHVVENGIIGENIDATITGNKWVKGKKDPSSWMWEVTFQTADGRKDSTRFCLQHSKQQTVNIAKDGVKKLLDAAGLGSVNLGGQSIPELNGKRVKVTGKANGDYTNYYFKPFDTVTSAAPAAAAAMPVNAAPAAQAQTAQGMPTNTPAPAADAPPPNQPSFAQTPPASASPTS